MYTAIWANTQENRPRYNGGYFTCPHCGEYCPSSISGYRFVTRLCGLPVMGAKYDWRRVCTSCGQSDLITSKEAKKAAVDNNEWPAYVSAVKEPSLRWLALILILFGLLLSYFSVSPYFSPVHRVEGGELSELRSGDYVSFDELYLWDYYGYEVSEYGDTITDYYFLAFYFEGEDPTPYFVSLHVNSGELLSEVESSLNDNGNYIGDFCGPVYGSVSSLDDTMQSYYEDGIAVLSQDIDLTNTAKNVHCYGAERGAFEIGDLFPELVFVLLGIALMVFYYCKDNPNRPPKYKTV